MRGAQGRRDHRGRHEVLRGSRLRRRHRDPATLVQRARQDARAQRRAGKLIVYASTPISPRGGGHVETDLEIAPSVKSRLEKEYGGAVWVLDPGRY